MIERLQAVCAEIEDMSAMIMNGCIDRSVLQHLGKPGEGDPEQAMEKTDELLSAALSSIMTLMELIEGVQK